MKKQSKLKVDFEGKTKIPNSWGTTPQLEIAISKIKRIHEEIDKKFEEISRTCRDCVKDH